MTVWLLTSFNENLDVKLINTQSIKSCIFMSVHMQFDTHLLKKKKYLLGNFKVTDGNLSQANSHKLFETVNIFLLFV